MVRRMIIAHRPWKGLMLMLVLIVSLNFQQKSSYFVRFVSGHIDESSEVLEDTFSDNLAMDANDDIIPPIFVLNLDRSPDRWKRVSEEFTKAGLTVNGPQAQVIRIPAIDGRALSASELRVETTFLSRHLQPRGVIGCYLSHRKFWKMVVDLGLDRAIVLEDDIVMVDDFKEQLAGNIFIMF